MSTDSFKRELHKQNCPGGMKCRQCGNERDKPLKRRAARARVKTTLKDEIEDQLENSDESIKKEVAAEALEERECGYDDDWYLDYCGDDLDGYDDYLDDTRNLPPDNDDCDDDTIPLWEDF